MWLVLSTNINYGSGELSIDPHLILSGYWPHQLLRINSLRKKSFDIIISGQLTQIRGDLGGGDSQFTAPPPNLVLNQIQEILYNDFFLTI